MSAHDDSRLRHYALLDLLGRENRLPDAAALLARHGVPVFPCLPGTKKPAVKHGFLAATTDVEQVQEWWGRWPNANLAVPTGDASGIDVVDVDRNSNNDGMLAFSRARRTGLLAGWAALVRTPSDGLHVYFVTDPDRPQRSWQAAPAHIDFRGNGGYVVIPPSRVNYSDGSSGQYVLRAQSQAPTLPVDGTALRKFLVPERQKRAGFNNQQRRHSSNNFAGLVAQLAVQPEGNRNGFLFFAACRMVEAGEPRQEVYSLLGPAAEQAGLEYQEIGATIESAYRHTQPQHSERRHRAKPPPVTESRLYRPQSERGQVIA
ncbi:DNA primase [Leucobacter coleopterorum]|uniref:DNA primase n=1 Tax=Leucobacter coleopterorum TaxID=2714933 RepID=A0ABX6JWK6_9MICO|nr:bifunctional DNA primase/polymerase [Leucobacter coleopterorum]QIM18688.1 DNA primase [Leucobacter coleopterorum]